MALMYGCTGHARPLLSCVLSRRAFENVRRRLFAAQALPFLMYLSALANSERVDNFPQTAEQNHSDYQNAKSFIKGRQRRPSSIWEGSVVPKLNGSPWRYGGEQSPVNSCQAAGCEWTRSMPVTCTNPTASTPEYKAIGVLQMEFRGK